MITVRYSDGMVTLHFPYDEYLIDLIKTTCSNRKWFPDRKCWSVGIADLETLLIPTLKAKGIPYTLDESYTSFFKQPEEYVSKITEFKTKLPLYTYQIVGANKLIENRRFYLMDSIGLGKTAEVLAALNYLQLKNVLIVVPNSIKKQWLDETNKFTNMKATIVDGNKEQRLKLWQEGGIKITNYEKLRCKDDFGYIKNLVFDCIVLDEATKVKNRQTQIFNAVNNLTTLRLWAMSGTPIENSVQDIYSIYQLLNRELFGNWFSFKTNFLITETMNAGGREFEVITGSKNLELLRELIKPSSLRRTKREVEQYLPPIVEETVWVDLNPAEEKWYKKLENLKNSKRNLGQDYLGELQLMRSLCNGEICLKKSQTTNEEVKSWLEEVGTSSTKVDTTEELLNDLLKENGEKIIVFSDFVVPLLELKERLVGKGVKIAELHGGVSNREEQISDFQFNPNTRVMLCQTRTGGFGLNLQQANIVIFLNRDYNPSVEEQAVGRVYRTGQTKHVFIYYILVSDSREDEINNLIREKLGVVNMVVKEDVKQYI